MTPREAMEQLHEWSEQEMIPRQELMKVLEILRQDAERYAHKEFSQGKESAYHFLLFSLNPHRYEPILERRNETCTHQVSNNLPLLSACI